MPETSELDKLIDSVDPRVKVPRGFVFWSERLQLVWLRHHQRTPKPAEQGAPGGHQHE